MQAFARTSFRALAVCCTWIIAAASAVHTGADTTLPNELTNAIKRAKLPYDAVSFFVQPIRGTQPTLSFNAEQPRNPASTMKLVTTLVALEELGPTYTWYTDLYALGPINNGVLHGDLLLKGRGDPSLLSEDVWKMLRQLRRSGLKKITGDLLVDDSYFELPQQRPGDFDGEAHRPYNVLPSAILINYKTVEFSISPAGKQVEISTEPPLPTLKIDNAIKVSNSACRGRSNSVSFSVPDAAQDNYVRFGGGFPARCGTWSVTRAAMSHAEYARGIFTGLWREVGGEFDGKVRVGKAPPKAKPLLRWPSRPLADVIRPINKWSNNVMSRQLLLTLGAERYGAPGTPEKGANAVYEFVTDIGLDPISIKVENGAGLSRVERVTARILGALLLHAANQPFQPEFISSLSLAGLDGTTRRRFRGGAEAGNMHLKTGTLNDVSAIAGYVHAKSGQDYVIVGLVNHPRANSGGPSVMNSLARWTFDQ